MNTILIVEPHVLEAAKSIAKNCDVFPFSIAEDIDSRLDMSEMVKGRRVVLWPDMNQFSISKMRDYGQSLAHNSDDVQIVLPQGQADGWNIGSAISDGWDWAKIIEWVKPLLIRLIHVPVTTTEAPDPVPEKAVQAWERFDLALSNNGMPIVNIDNVVRILECLPQLSSSLWYDEFYDRYLTTWNGGMDYDPLINRSPREWTDNDDLALTLMFQKEFGLGRMGDDVVNKGVKAFANINKKNEPLEWIKAQAWDGKSRIDNFFINYFGVPATPYAHAVSRNFWIALIARAYRPGCQVDNMVILEGKQGIFKSKGLEAIGGKWYMEASEEITSKDFVISIQGKLLVEIADLDSFSRADTNRIKKVITCRNDRYRAPYARTAQDNPRRAIFVGTTNEQHYLRDNTGARRFWPLVCGKIDLDNIWNDRSKLFAEARTRYLANEDWYKMPAEMTTEEQEARRQYDEWENIIGQFIIGRNEATVTDISDHLGFEKSRLGIMDQKRIASILRRLGWNNKTVKRGFSSQKIWFPEQDAELLKEASAPLLPLQS